jgi:hypothetical protein
MCGPFIQDLNCLSSRLIPALIHSGPTGCGKKPAAPSSSHFSIPAACTARVAVPQTALASIAAIAVTSWITSAGIAAAFSMPGPERFFRGCSGVLHRSCRYFVDSPEEYLPPSWPGRFLAIASTSANCAGGSSRTPPRYSIPASWRTPASTTTKPPKGEDERQRNEFAGPTWLRSASQIRGVCGWQTNSRGCHDQRSATGVSIHFRSACDSSTASATSWAFKPS